MAKWSNINPQTASEMTPREIRKTYSELRSIARKRADRLEAAGFKTRRFKPVANIDAADLELELVKVAYYLRDPGSSIRVARKEKEQTSIAARGYDIRDFDTFGDFMDEIRYRFKGRDLRDSDPYAQIYDAAEKRQMTIKTIQREFGKYMNYVETARIVRDEIVKLAKEKTSERLTARQLQEMIEKRNIDAVYNRLDSDPATKKPSGRSKTEGKSRKKK